MRSAFLTSTYRDNGFDDDDDKVRDGGYDGGDDTPDSRDNRALRSISVSNPLGNSKYLP